MLASYHNHTTWSDGNASVADVIEGARALGLEELGISDHFTLHPGGLAIPWSMPVERVGEYVAELREAAGRPGGPTLRVGLEVDWFPSQAPALREALDRLPLDYRIGSVHFVGGDGIDVSARRWHQWTPQRRDEVHAEYWRLVGLMARSGLFDIAAHLDLPKKFGFPPRRDMGPLIGEALDAVAASGMVVELNTSGWHRACGEAYPSAAILAQCRERGIPATISADAHDPAHLLRDFGAAARALEQAGYTEVARFAGRRVSFEPIASAAPAGA